MFHIWGHRCREFTGNTNPKCFTYFSLQCIYFCYSAFCNNIKNKVIKNEDKKDGIHLNGYE